MAHEGLDPGAGDGRLLLIGVDLVGLFHGEADVVQAVEEAVPLKLIDVEMDDSAIRPRIS